MSEAAAPPPAAATPFRGALLLAVAGLTPVLAYVGNLGFAPVVAFAGLLCLPIAAARRLPSTGVALLLGLVVWAVASLGWTIHPPAAEDLRSPGGMEGITALKLVFQLVLYSAFVLAMAGLSRRSAGRAAATFGFGLGLLGVVMLIESATGAAGYQALRRLAGDPTRPDWARRDVARAAYIVALLFWPAVLGLRPRKWVGVAAVAAATLGLVVGALVLNVATPLAALAAGGAVFALVGRFGRRIVAVWAGLVGAYFVLAPVLLRFLASLHPLGPPEQTVGKASWAARLDLWSFAGDRIFERPWFGWGLDASRAFPAIPLHTHDLAVQLWLELGVVGAVLGGLFFVWIAGLIDRLEETDRWAAAAAAATATAYLVIGALSFGAWQEWWLALGALAFVACGTAALSRRFEAPAA